MRSSRRALAALGAALALLAGGGCAHAPRSRAEAPREIPAEEPAEEPSNAPPFEEERPEAAPPGRLDPSEEITPEDFRLRSNSAGHRAGPGGKDLGADVDLVGPGPAYERWKKTPEYQRWLKDTKQAK